MRLRKRSIAVTGTLVVGMSTIGVAMASWLTTGTGPANGQAVTAASVTIAARTPTPNLYPKPAGASSMPTGYGDVYGTASNPNPYPVRLTTVSYGAVTVTPASGKTCASTNVQTTAGGTLTTPIDLPANSGTVNFTIPAALEMITNADDQCQGAIFSVVVTLTGASV